MGFGVILLIAPTTAAALAADPASTTTTPSSPTWTPTFPPAPAIMKKLGRTSNTSRPSADVAREACAASAVGATDVPPSTTSSAVHIATAMVSGQRRTPFRRASITSVAGKRSIGLESTRPAFSPSSPPTPPSFPSTALVAFCTRVWVVLAVGNLLHHNSRTKTRTQSLDVVHLEHEVRTMELLRPLFVIRGLVGMHHEHRLLETETILDAFLCEDDRSYPAIVRGKAVERFQREIEFPLAFVALAKALHVPLVDAVIGFPERQPLSQPGQDARAATGHCEKRAVEDDARDEP